MERDRQLGLLEAIARAVGVTQADSAVRSLTIGKLFVAYKASRERGRQWQLERNLLRPFVVRFWRWPAEKITPADWREHRAARQKQPTRTGRPPTELTVNLELSRAKGMCRWGVKSGKIARNPLEDCKRVKTKTRRGSWFTADQIDRLITFSTALRWRHQQAAFAALVAVMGDTGLRISEALSLRWDRITLRGTTSVLGKGAKARVVAFTPRALRLLGELDRHPHPFVFVNWKRGCVFDPSTVRSWFRQVIKAADLEGVKAEGDFALVPHILRHSAASIADERGAPLTWIQGMLGHSVPSTTMLYVHRSESDNAIRMAAIMSGRRPARRIRKSTPIEKEIATTNAKRVFV